MKHHRFLAAVFAVCALAGCVKSPDMPMQTLSVGEGAIVAPYMGAEYNVSVTSNSSWKADFSRISWAGTTDTEFTGSAVLKISVDSNPGGERSAVIRISTADGKIVRDLNLVQAGKDSEGYISIASLRKLEKQDGPTSLSGNTSKIRGFVVSDAVSSNWFDNTVAIEDSFTESESGISVTVTNDYKAFASGEEVSVGLDGAVLKRNASGVLVLETGISPERTDATQLTVEPLLLDWNNLSTGDYESMLVKIKDFQVTAEYIGNQWAASPLFQNADDKQVKIMVNENASFASMKYNEGIGSISGISAANSQVPELWPVNLSGIDLSNKRIGVKPGLRQLPYVFPFYCYQQVDGSPKYVKYTKLKYDSATHLVTGVVASELDENKGVYLELTAYGKAESNIYSGGTNYWAEPGAHDNINTSGFVSLDNGKTVPPAECGFFLTVPLQMEMPSDFNVSFGLAAAGGDWALKNWALSWSDDKVNWQEAGRVSIARKTQNGSYYFYYTVPVHLDKQLLPDSYLYLKLTPKGSQAVGGGTTADGHGVSCQIRLHTGFVISVEKEGNTAKPQDAIYFQPFDNLVAGLDYFIGERLGAFANYCADDISKWSEEKRSAMTGTNVRERPGYAQIGYVNTETPSSRSSYTNEVGILETPELGAEGALSLSFKAAIYRTPAIRPNAATTTPDVGSPDISSIVVEVLGGGTIDGKTSVVVKDLPSDAFKTVRLKIDGAQPSTKLRFTSAPADGQFSRWFIDDIAVTK